MFIGQLGAVDLEREFVGLAKFSDAVLLGLSIECCQNRPFGHRQGQKALQPRSPDKINQMITGPGPGRGQVSNRWQAGLI
jgi:hypothetical protein